MTIVSKIIITVCLVIFSSSMIILIFNLKNVKQIIVDESVALATADADHLLWTIKHEREQIERIAKIISLNPQIIQALNLKFIREENDILNRLIKIYPGFNYILLTDLKGDILAANTRIFSDRKINGEELLGLNSKLNPLHQFKNHSNPTAASHVDHDPYFKILNLKKEFSQWFRLPISDKGKQLGYVIISYKWQSEMIDFLASSLHKITHDKSQVSELAIIDSKNIVLAGQQTSMGKTFIAINNPYTSISIFDELMPHLRLAISFNEDVLLEPANSITQKSILTVLSCSAGAIILLILFLDKVLIQKLKEIQTGCEQITKGNLDHRIRNFPQDEIGILANHVNTMASSIKDKIDEINKARGLLEINVEERTQDLRASEKKLNTIIDVSPIALIIINEEGNINLFNKTAEEYFGYSREEIQGQCVNILVPDRIKSTHTAMVNSFFHTPKKILGVDRANIQGQRKNGELFSIDLSLAYLDIKEGPHALALVTDVTNRKLAEEKIEKYTRQLEKSNQELDEFAYITSHDLKEPMRSISTYSKFLIEDHEDQLDQEGKDTLHSIERLGKRMIQLLSDLLYYSKVGRSELANSEVNLNKTLKHIEDSIAPMIKEKNVKVKTPQPLPVITCDKVRVEEVFRNLITNAIKYNDQSEKCIEVGVRFANENDLDYVQSPQQQVFYVKDNGIGIKKEHQKEVFKIFRRLHTQNEYSGGTGSGLTLTQKILKRMGGQIWLESEPGKGSTFKFTLNGTRDENS